MEDLITPQLNLVFILRAMEKAITDISGEKQHDQFCVLEDHF